MPGSEIMKWDRVRKLILFIGVFHCFLSRSSGQNSPGTLGSEFLRPASASFYYIAKPGELSMQVNVWGFVKNPGRFEIPTSTDLVKLLSYAGGPTQDGILYNVRVVRNVTSTSGKKAEEFSVDLENLANVDPRRLVLYPDDTIYIDHSSWVNLRDLFVVITTAALVSAAVAQIIIATNR